MKLFYAPFLFILLIACGNHNKQEYKNLAHYDLSTPAKLIMPESLLEISGIAFHNNVADTIYAIQDEQGKLFRVPLGEKEALKTKFGKQGDYEDVAIMQETVFVLKSNGSVYAFPFSQAYNDETDSTAEFKNILPKGEYESMYADANTGTIYILCKNCSVDKKKAAVSGYTFKWQSNTLVPTEEFAIAIGNLKLNTGSKQKRLRPSAITKNPLTKEWFILASAEKLLVVTDANWKVTQTVELDPNTFNQPEGIAFDKDNNLYISNEGNDIVNGNILRFEFKP